ncbi:MAG: biotin--[acetyl-CoA-carboxylase] ligase, partial [Candidatus Eiseniibacteriota bacterium]
VLLAVLADVQTHGRGRAGRTWISPPGTGLYFSAYLRPGWTPGRTALLTLAAGLAAIECCAEAGARPALKWPNDLMAPDDTGRKLGGILTETRTEGRVVPEAVIGIGINLRPPPGGWPPELDGLGVSLEELAEAARRTAPGIEGLIAPPAAPAPPLPDTESFATRLLARLDEEIEILARDGGELDLIARGRERSGLWGRRIRVEGEGGTVFGVARDLAEDGGLVVRLDSGIERVVHSGDVRVTWSEP